MNIFKKIETKVKEFFVGSPASKRSGPLRQPDGLHMDMPGGDEFNESFLKEKKKRNIPLSGQEYDKGYPVGGLATLFGRKKVIEKTATESGCTDTDLGSFLTGL